MQCDYLCGQGDFNQAAYWYKLCSAYNPHYYEAAVNLMIMHMAFDQVQEALRLLDSTLQQAPQEREMLNTLHLSECTLPRTALFVLPRAAKEGVLREAEGVALFALLLLRGMQHKGCPAEHMKREDEEWLRDLLAKHGRNSKSSVY